MRVKKSHLIILSCGCFLLTFAWFFTSESPSLTAEYSSQRVLDDSHKVKQNAHSVSAGGEPTAGGVSTDTPSLSTCQRLYGAAVQQQQEQGSHSVEQLQALATHLQQEVDALTAQITQLKTTGLANRHPVTSLPPVSDVQCENVTTRFYNPNSVAIQGVLAELRQGLALHNEYELVPYVRFTKDRMYIINPGLGKRVVEKPIGFTKREINEVMDYGVNHLTQYNFNKAHFVEGIYRTVPGAGTYYELYYNKPGEIVANKSTSAFEVSVFRPFALPQTVKISSTFTRRSRLINLILPLSERLSSFSKFMSRYISVCIKYDGNVMLTIVYFGASGMSDVRRIVAETVRMFPQTVIEVVEVAEPFSRARAIEEGVSAWSGRGAAGGDVLMFVCDVDIAFSTDFLQRCRQHTSPGNARGGRVYFPLVFSLYRPSVVYRLQDKAVPPESEQFVISKHTGWWRDFGYGMVCVYQSDLVAVAGSGDGRDGIVGWGMEDVNLYRKFVRSTLQVVRATDPGIFHVWHEKSCDPHLATDQYRACIHSKALNEASHSQLGLLAFKDEVNIHLNAKRVQSPAGH